MSAIVQQLMSYGGEDPLSYFNGALYTGDATYPRTISSGGVDASQGLVWTKSRNAAEAHQLTFSQGGSVRRFATNSTTATAVVTNATVDGSGLTLANGTGVVANTSATDYVVYFFKKNTGFLDLVTFTGDGTASRAVNHSLGVVPGMYWAIPRAAASRPFYHVGTDTTAPQDYYLDFLTTNNRQAAVNWGNAAPSSTQFNVGFSAGNGSNASAVVYDVFLWGHDITSSGRIACGRYTGNGIASGPIVTLGWQPRLVMMKNWGTNGTNWCMVDQFRSPSFSTATDARLQPTSTAAEDTSSFLSLTSDGFQLGTGTNTNVSGQGYIYIAIR